MKREPISDDYAARLIAAAKEGEIYTYGASGGEESQFTVMGGLNTIPRDQYVPKQVLFDLLYTLTEPVEYINGKDPAGYVFGSGPIGFNEDACYSHYLREFVRDNDDYVSIAHTQSAQLLTEPEFANIIRYQLLTAMKEEGIDADGNPASTYYNGLMGHKREDGTMELGLWDAVSLGFAENAHGHVVTLTPRADNERIFVRTELPALLKNEQVETINGLPKQDFVDAFDQYCADGLSEEDAYTKLNRTKIMGSSYEFMRGYSEGFAEALPPHLHHDFQKVTVDGYADWVSKAAPVLSPSVSIGHYDFLDNIGSNDQQDRRETHAL